MSEQRVVIGLDVGSARIGVARGDREVRIATPLAALANDGAIFASIARIVKENHAETVVIGLPRDATGQETAQSEVSRDFAAKLAGVTDVEIVFQDESLTSVTAEQNLRIRKDFQEAMLRDGTLDSAAAAIIVQDYLEGGRRGSA